MKKLAVTLSVALVAFGAWARQSSYSSDVSCETVDGVTRSYQVEDGKSALSSAAKQGGMVAVVKAAKAKLAFSSATKKLATTPKKGTAGESFSLKIGVSASSSSLSFSAKSLPKGLSIGKKSGKISGMPLKPGSFTAKVTVKDSAGNSISQKVKFKIAVPSYAKGTFYGTAMLDGKTKSYMQFTIGSTGKVSGKVNYKGKWKTFNSTLVFYSQGGDDGVANFTPTVDLGSKTTFKPGLVWVEKQWKGGFSYVRAENESVTVFAQKKSGLVKAGKSLEALVGTEYKFTKKDDANSGLTKSKDKLVVKVSDGDAVTVSGTIKGTKISAIKWALLFFHREPSVGGGGETIYLSAEVCEPSLKYYRRIVFRVYVTQDGEVGDPAVSFQE